MGLFNLFDEDIQRAAKSYTEEMAQKQLKKDDFYNFSSRRSYGVNL